MSDLHKEHRKRMDEKSETAGLFALPEHEVLEKILFAVVPRGNTNEIAKELCDRFGGIGNVLTADINELTEVKGVGRRIAYFLHELPDVLGIVERSLSFANRQIKDRNDACEYVKTFFYGKVMEQFYMISLTSTGHIIKCTKLSDGVSNEVHVYTRNVAKIAMQDKAHSVIIAHNHPGGTLQPSYSDIKCTEQIATALKTLGIKLYESIVVARGEGKSIFDDDRCNIKE